MDSVLFCKKRPCRWQKQETRDGLFQSVTLWNKLQSHIEMSADCVYVFVFFRLSHTCLTSTPVKGCWRESIPTFSIRWVQATCDVGALDKLQAASLSLSFMFILFSNQAPHTAQYFIWWIQDADQCVCMCLWLRGREHVYRVYHPCAFYKWQVCPQALLSLMRTEEQGWIYQVWAWWW